MVEVNKIKGRMAELGIPVLELAFEMGISPSTFYRKMKEGGQHFTVKEAFVIANKLRMSKEEASRIFFAS